MGYDLIERLRAVPLPSFVVDVLDRAAEAGGHAYVVGGAARNVAWGVPVADWDLATDLALDVLVRWYGQHHPGLRFGTVRAHPRVEVTVLREETEGLDNRHPGRIGPVRDIGKDLARRDFTVNAIAFNRQGVWHVPQAPADLSDRRWRTVGNASRRFQEDALRVVRLARLGMTYGGELDAETVEAARRARPLTRTLSRERRLAELERMLEAPGQDWRPYRVLGLDATYERPAPEPIRWPRPFGRDARLLFWLREGFAAWVDAEGWIRQWPFRREVLRDLIGAGPVLWASDDPEAWVRGARLGEAGAGILADFAAVGGAVPPWHAMKLALDANAIARRFGIAGRELGRTLRALRQLVAEDPGRNTPEALSAYVSTRVGAHDSLT